MTEQLTTRIGREAISVAGRTTVRELAALVEACDLYLGAETGAAHMAAAVGTPAVVVLGGGHFGRFSPYPHADSVRVVYNRLPCYGCDWVCTRPQVECILGIDEDSVVRAALDLLSAARHSNRMAKIA